MLYTIAAMVVLTAILFTLRKVSRDGAGWAFAPLIVWGWLRMVCPGSAGVLWTAGVFALAWIDVVALVSLVVMVIVGIVNLSRLSR